MKDMHYRVKGVLEVFKDLAMAKINQKLLHKVMEVRKINLGK